MIIKFKKHENSVSLYGYLETDIMRIKKPKIKDNEIVKFRMNPYYDEILIFGDIIVPTSQEKYKLIDAEDQLYKKISKSNVDNFSNLLKNRLRAKAKNWWPYKGDLEIIINIGGPKKYIKFKDLDNYLKTIFDAIKGVVIIDDHQITIVTIDKHENPYTNGFSIAIRKIQEDSSDYVYGQNQSEWEKDSELKIKNGGICCIDAY